MEGETSDFSLSDVLSLTWVLVSLAESIMDFYLCTNSEYINKIIIYYSRIQFSFKGELDGNTKKKKKIFIIINKNK